MFQDIESGFVLVVHEAIEIKSVCVKGNLAVFLCL